MKKAALILSALLFSSIINITFAENDSDKAPKTVTISGTVIDKTSQEVLAGALIKLEGTEIEVYTDLDGKFTISGIVPDKYKVKCSMISYTDREEEIEIGSATKKVEIELQNYAVDSSAR